MNGLRQRKLRVQRMQAIEQNQMNVLAVELSSVEAQIQTYKNQIQELELELDSLGDDAASRSLALQNQMSVWAMEISRRTLKLEELVSASESERDAILDKVLQAKTKVKGWESLIEKLDQQGRHEEANIEAAIADDMYLVKQKR